MAGIQSLTLTLAISVILATGLLLAGISISTGNKSTDDARATGDKGTAQCMASGSESVKGITSRLLSSVLSDIKNKVLTTLSIPKKLSRDVTNFIKLYHPDEVANPNFLDNDLRSFLYATVKFSSSSGVRGSLGFTAWNVTPNSESLSKQHGGWGGELNFFVVAFRPDGTPILSASETRLGENQSINFFGRAYFGDVDATGKLIPGPCDYRTRTGICSVELGFSEDPEKKLQLDRCFRNLKKPEGFLSAVGETLFSPLSSSGPTVSIQSCTSTWSPHQVDKYPRQGKRTGYVSASINLLTISDEMRRATVPTGSILYSAERDPRDGKVKSVSGCSIGTASYAREIHVGGEIRHIGEPFPLVNHTMNGSLSGELSPIARFSRFMFAMSHNSESGTHYDYLSNLPSSVVSDWTDPDTNVLYWIRITSIKLDGLHWYLVFLVPRDSAMELIDEALNAISISFEEDKKKTDDKMKKNHIIMYVVSVVCIVLLLVLSVLFTNMIITPLKLLQDDMISVSLMQTDAVDLNGPLSSLHEVRQMQQSFRVVASNMAEYKSFMPQSALLQQTDTENACSLEHSSHASGSSIGRSGELITNRNVTVLLVNTVGWHSRERSDRESMELHTTLITTLTNAVESCSGVCDTFDGDRMMMYFNANRNNGGHRESAVRAGMMSRKELAGVFTLAFGASSGEAKVGIMGVVGMKKFTILSSIVPFAASLEKCSSAYGYSGLVDAAVAQRCPNVDCCATLLVSMTKHSLKPQLVYEPKAFLEGDDDWMCRLDNTDTHADWNKFVCFITDGHFKEARELKDSVKNFSGEVYSKWNDFLTSEKATILSLS
eukprot:TRINITY_DN6908_c0_g1_i1.p1 TRINITY_DN6908_c0_g1~~TRINITY_DN6908_c0_g1_i1.p1  ORF type:complete len:831 (+),score=114.46 TRINITY_DN6908_c0_g1_i1:71-2563(+)